MLPTGFGSKEMIEESIDVSKFVMKEKLYEKIKSL